MFTVGVNAWTKWSERISQSCCTPPSHMARAEAVHICVHGVLPGSICFTLVSTLEPCVHVSLLFWSFCFLPLADLLTICEETTEIVEAKKISPRVKMHDSMILKVWPLYIWDNTVCLLLWRYLDSFEDMVNLCNPGPVVHMIIVAFEI